MKFLRITIGKTIGIIGGKLWWREVESGREEYENLTVFGKFGYQLFCEGTKLMLGVKTMSEAAEIIHNTIN